MALTKEQLASLPQDAIKIKLTVNEHLQAKITSGNIYTFVNKTCVISKSEVYNSTQDVYIKGSSTTVEYSVLDNRKYVVFNTKTNDNTSKETYNISKDIAIGSNFIAKVAEAEEVEAVVQINEGCKSVKFIYQTKDGTSKTVTSSTTQNIKVKKYTSIQYTYLLKDDWEYFNGSLSGTKEIVSANKSDNVIGISPTKKGIPHTAPKLSDAKTYTGTQIYVPFVDGKKIKTTAKYYIYNAQRNPQLVTAEISSGTDKEGYKTLTGSIIGEKSVVVSYEDIPSGYTVDKNPLEVVITKNNQQIGSKNEPIFSKQTVKPGESSGGNNTPGSTGTTGGTTNNPTESTPVETNKNPEQPVLKPNGTKYELVVKGTTNQQYKIEVIYNDDSKQTHTYNYTKLEDRIRDLPYGSTYAISFKADDGYIPTEAINGTIKDNVELGPFEAKKKIEVNPTTPPSGGNNPTENGGSSGGNNNGSTGTENNNKPVPKDYKDVYNEFWDKYRSNKKDYKDVYNEFYDIYSNGFEYVYPKFYIQLLNALGDLGKNKKKLEGDSDWTYSSGKENDNSDINIGSTLKEIRELRKTPGFTSYVTDVQKDVYGNVLDSATLKRYYSNIDAEIYINGVWLEDISSIQWTVDQQTMPLYGYNSYIFDAIAQGSRIIQGMFTVAFTVPRKVEKFIRDYSEITDATKIDGTKLTYENLIKELSTKEVKLNRNGSILTSNKQHKPIWMNNKFDIDIVCGEYEAIGGNAVHIILKECWITRVGSMRVKDGGVAEEVYSFLARDYKTIT